MYKLTAPKLLIFIPIVLLGIIFSAVTPIYIDADRILSSFSLFIGQIGMSFVPIIALFPNARLLQAIVLAVIYLIITLIMCLSSWAFYGIGITPDYAFMWKDNQFHVNIFSLFVANIFSCLAIYMCFKLVYDEELAKKIKSGKVKSKGGKRFDFANFQSNLLKRPIATEVKNKVKETPKPQEKKTHDQSTEISSSSEDLFGDEDFGKPFDFEPEKDVLEQALPEESSGGLLSSEENEASELSEFFDDSDESAESSVAIEEAPAAKQHNAFPADIKDELNSIFEQYDSLDSVKKLTAEKSEELKQKKQEVLEQKDKIEMVTSFKLNDSEIEEAKFTIEESQDESPKETTEEVKEESEVIKNNDESEEASIGSFESIFNTEQEAKKEPEEEPQSPVVEEAKEEIVEEVKEETVREVEPKQEAVLEKEHTVEEEEVELLSQFLNNVNKDRHVKGALFVSEKGNVIAKELDPGISQEDLIGENITQVISMLNNQLAKTKQGELAHLLMESDGGMVVVVAYHDKLLLVITEGREEIYIAQLLRNIAQIEEEMEV